MGRSGDPRKRNQVKPRTLWYKERIPGDPGRGVVTGDGLIGFAPSQENAELVRETHCRACKNPVKLQWHLLDDLDEHTEAAFPIALSCSDPKCYPYIRQEILQDLDGRGVTLADLAADGQREPVDLGADGRVWDGHHRIFAAVVKGDTHIKVRHVGRYPEGD